MDLLSRLETMLSDYASLFKHNNFHTFVTGRKNCDKQWHGQNKTAFVVAQFIAPLYCRARSLLLAICLNQDFQDYQISRLYYSNPSCYLWKIQKFCPN